MYKSSLLFILATILPAQTLAPGAIMSVTGELANGLLVYYDCRIEPPLKDSQILLMWNGVQDGRDRIHRSMRDKTTGEIIGYDLLAEPAGAPDRFLVRIEPLTKTMSEGRLAPLPKYPPPQTVQEGDTIVLDVLASPDGRQKLVDYIRVTRRLEPGAARTTAEARDFTLDDGPAAFQFATPTRFYINGLPFPGGVGFTTMRSGATLWFAVPNHGRYILSLTPREGFEKSGAIRDNVVTFQSGADSYEYRASSPILGAGKAWNLYVLHDPRYQPKAGMQSAVSGGVDRLENLLVGPLMDKTVKDLQEMLRRKRN